RSWPTSYKSYLLQTESTRRLKTAPPPAKALKSSTAPGANETKRLISFGFWCVWELFAWRFTRCVAAAAALLLWDRLPWDRLPWDRLPWDRLPWDRLPWDRLHPTVHFSRPSEGPTRPASPSGRQQLAAATRSSPTSSSPAPQRRPKLLLPRGPTPSLRVYLQLSSSAPGAPTALMLCFPRRPQLA
ncbi:hypothetical protein ETH_00035855, partial [Eimeria tenella]